MVIACILTVVRSLGDTTYGKFIGDNDGGKCDTIGNDFAHE